MKCLECALCFPPPMTGLLAIRVQGRRQQLACSNQRGLAANNGNRGKVLLVACWEAEFHLPTSIVA